MGLMVPVKGVESEDEEEEPSCRVKRDEYAIGSSAFLHACAAAVISFTSKTEEEKSDMRNGEVSESAVSEAHAAADAAGKDDIEGLNELARVCIKRWSAGFVVRLHIWLYGN